jgi:hypothetical protein
MAEVARITQDRIGRRRYKSVPALPGTVLRELDVAGVPMLL